MLKNRLINYSYFVVFNILLANIIAVGYYFNEFANNFYFFTDIQHKKLAYIFYIFNHLWRISLIPLIVGLFSLPIIFLHNKTRFIIQALMACISIGFLIYDIRVFYSCQVHLTELYPRNILGEDITFTTGRLILLLCVFLLFIIELGVNYIIDKLKLFSKYRVSTLSIFPILLVIACSISQGIFYLTFSKYEQQLITANRYWPLFFNKNEYLLLTNNNKQNFYFNKKTSLDQLNYPRNKLKTTVVSSPPNIVIIGIDAWRADCFNATDSPNLWNLSQKGTILNNHKSGANHTRLGLFSLFYAIPATYRYNFLKKRQSPIFIDRLQQLNYNLAVFMSYNYKNDSFDKTIFNKITNMCFIPNGETPSDCDKCITNAWLDWYENRDITKPHFSFLFYDSVHGTDFPKGYSNQYITTEGKYRHNDFVKAVGKQGFIGSYKTSVSYVDSLIAKIIQKLSVANDLTNTIIIITSDHGRELGDRQQSCFVNGNNFTDYQINVPCAIIGSKFNDLQPYCKQQLTTHYDIIPTILKNFLGVENDLADYSVGIDLLDKNHLKRKWSFTTNSLRHSMPCAIVDENIIFQWFPSGFYQFFNKQNHHVFNQTINKQRLAEAIDMMTRFLK